MEDEHDSDHDYNVTSTEAVAVFHDVTSFETAIDDLLVNGFDLAEISVLAKDQTIQSKIGRTYRSTKEFEDDPHAPRMGYVPNEIVGEAQGAVIGVATYIPAIVGVLAFAGTGGTIMGTAAVAAVAGGAGAVAGTVLARLIGSERASRLGDQLHRGGIVLWVRTHDAVHEQLAVEILKGRNGEDVHLHSLPPIERIDHIPTRRPLLSLGRVS